MRNMHEACFVNAIRIVDGRAEIGEDCRGCGRCVEACPESAVSITIPYLATINEAIKRIEDVVDVG